MQQPIRALVIEDNDADLRLVREYLKEQAGERRFQITEAVSLSLALNQARSGQFDVILLDLGLPDGAPLDSLRAMKEQAPATPIVVLSGTEDPTMIAAVRRQGANQFVSKSDATAERLVEALVKAVG